MKAHVQVRRRKEPELVEVIDRSPEAIKAHPETRFGRMKNQHLALLETDEDPGVGDIILGGTYSLYTRIWMGITPPKGAQPGYCAVVGEEFDGDFGPKQRRLFVLDEGVCLTGDPTVALIPDLMEAACALKDIYFPVHERESDQKSTGGDRRLCHNPGDQQFIVELLKMKWCISTYPDEDEVPDHILRERQPFYASRDRIAPLFEAPYAHDEDYTIKAVESLFSRNLLHHHQCCEILAEGQYRTPLRAIGLVCLALQTYDWHETMVDDLDYDGYPSEDIAPNADRSARDLLEGKIIGLLMLTGDAETRRKLQNQGRQGFLEVVQGMTGMSDEEIARVG